MSYTIIIVNDNIIIIKATITIIYSNILAIIYI